MEEEPRSLQELADRSGLSLFHFHRVFKSVTGGDAEAVCDGSEGGARAGRVGQGGLGYGGDLRGGV